MPILRKPTAREAARSDATEIQNSHTPACMLLSKEKEEIGIQDISATKISAQVSNKHLIEP